MNNADQLTNAFTQVRRLLTRSRQQSYAYERHIVNTIEYARGTFLARHVDATLSSIVEKLRDIQAGQTAEMDPAEKANLYLPRLKHGSEILPLGQVSQRKIQSYRIIKFKTRADDTLHGISVGFDAVDKIDDNFVPQIMNEGIDTVKFVQINGRDYYDFLGEAKTNDPDGLRAVLGFIEMRAIELTYTDRPGIVALQAAREARVQRKAGKPAFR